MSDCTNWGADQNDNLGYNQNINLQRIEYERKKKMEERS
jgi:hypothetical protein